MATAYVLLALLIAVSAMLGRIFYEISTISTRWLFALLCGALIIMVAFGIFSIVQEEGFRNGAGYLREETKLEEGILYITGFYASLMDGGFAVEVTSEKQETLWYHFAKLPPNVFMVVRLDGGKRVYIKKEFLSNNPPDQERLKKFRPKNKELAI